MKNIEINGLSFIQTHDEDPVRFDVRDTDFRRVAYIEYDGSRVLCTTKGGKIIYETEIDIKNPDMWLGHCADEINAHLEEKSAKKISNVTINMWRISGYKGFDNYDGPSDDNMHFDVFLDSRFNKEDVEEIFLNRFSKKHRTVALEATLVRELKLEER